MRWFAIGVATLIGHGVAHAEDVLLGAAIGAGAQGDATYGALELRLDLQPARPADDATRLGLGVRAAWDDGVFRKSDWSSASDLVTIVRDFAATTELGERDSDGRVGHLAIAAGRLAPSHVARLADGYRSTLDDRWRTGIRTAAVTSGTEATLEIDDVLAPVLIAGAVNHQLAPPWGLHAAFAIDPDQPTMPGAAGESRTAGMIEAGASRRFEDDRSRTDLGASIVAELGLGLHALGYIDSSIAVGETRYAIRADARAGSGTVGSMFGPLYRVERVAMWQRARAGELQGASFGATAGLAAPNGWLEVGLRDRPGLGMLATASAGAPMGTRVQGALWAAASAQEGAGAAELRVSWARRLFSAIQAARIYELADPRNPTGPAGQTMPRAIWSVTAWFGVASS
jgi:hypothetical protein